MAFEMKFGPRQGVIYHTQYVRSFYCQGNLFLTKHNSREKKDS